MKASSRIIAFILFTFLGTLARPAQSADRFDLSYFKLSNGLEVVVLPSHRAPLVLVQILYKVGAADGPPGKNGIAHFLEHLLFKGTSKFPDFDRQIQSRGGSDNANTGQDITTYYEIIAKEHLPLVLEMEADRMTQIQLSDAIVLPERDVILEERRQRIDNNPSAQLSEARDAALYQNHPYRLPVIGWMQEMQQLTTEDALAFYHRYYAPNNAVLVISGDVEEKEVRPLVEKFFAPLQRQDTPPRHRLEEPPHYAKLSLEMHSKLTEQPVVSQTYLAPSYRTARGNEAYALLILNEILDGETGLFYRDLTVKKHLAAGAGAYYSPRPYDQSAFGVWAYPYSQKDLPAIRSALQKILQSIVDKGVGTQELAKAKKRLKIQTVKTRADLYGPADIVGAALAVDRPLEDVQNWLDKVNAVTNDDIRQIAKKIFREGYPVEALLLPEKP